MATQTVTVQIDQGIADVVRALMAKIEASGKSTADFFAQMEADEQALVVEMENGKTMVLQDGSSYQKAMSDAEKSEVRKAVRRALDDIDAGRVKPFDQFDREMRQRFPFLAALPERK